MINKPKPKNQRRTTNKKPLEDAKKPLIEHVNEVRKRLFYVIISLAVSSGVGYFIHEQLLAIIQKPLGETLYYTSPIGGLNFLIKLCLTFGVIVALPILMYQIIRFVRPVLSNMSVGVIAKYLTFSALFAYAGVAFAYFISLPAALNFLSNFGGENITSLITADEYYSFALAYLTGFAVLFQLPIIILFINKIKPLKPGKMMGFQRYVILGSFIIAAILTPTPDPINQTIMAMPAILLYQVSVVLVWLINRRAPSRRRSSVDIVPDLTLEDDLEESLVPEKSVVSSKPALQPKYVVSKPLTNQVISDFMPQKSIPTRQPINRPLPTRVAERPKINTSRQEVRVIDNIIPARSVQSYSR